MLRSPRLNGSLAMTNMLSIILSRRDWREADQIISLYTLEHGKVEVLARGVKKILSKNSAYLEPGCLLEAEVIAGKEINHLGSTQPINIFKNIRSSLLSSLMVCYAVALLNKIIHSGEPDEKIFCLYKNWLEFLDSTKIVNIILLDSLIIKLYSFLGFDILYWEKVPISIKNCLLLLARGDFNKINFVKIKESEYKQLRKTILEFVIYHSETKIKDWQKLANISVN